MARRLIALLAVCGLAFTIGGCTSTPDTAKQESHELFKPQTKMPSYYLTAKEIGNGYKLQEYPYSEKRRAYTNGFIMAHCIEIYLPNYDDLPYIFYKNPDKHRNVTLLVHKIKKKDLNYYRDVVSRLSYRYDKECRKECRPDYDPQEYDGYASWLVVHSSRIEGLSHNGFGLRMTEWWPLYNKAVSYPPTQKQLETDKRILADSSARAYGRIGEYIITVFIDTATQEPPSEQELKHLWNLQVEKLLKHIEKEK